MATGEHSLKNPAEVEDADLKCLVCSVIVLEVCARSVGNVLARHEVVACVTSPSACHRIDVRPKFAAPIRLCTEGKRPPLGCCRPGFADIPGVRDVETDGICLGVDLAVPSASWASVWQQVGTDFSLAQSSRKRLEVGLLTTAGQL